MSNYMLIWFITLMHVDANLVDNTWHMFNVSVRINQRGSGSREERPKVMISKNQVIPMPRKRRM